MALVKSLNNIVARLLTINQGSMNTNLCLIVKLLSVAVLASPSFLNMGKPFLSYFEVVEFGLKGLPIHFIWKMIFYAAAVMILFNIAIRLNAAIMGILIFIGLALSENVYSNNVFFCGCLFFLCGLSSPKYGTWPIVLQLMIMYFGAAIDKLFFESWRDGSFYTSFHGKAFYMRFLGSLVPSVNFALIISWGTIVLEFAMIPLLFFRKSRHFALCTGLVFHLSTALLGQTLYSVFIPALLISYISLLPDYDLFKLYNPGTLSRLVYTQGFIKNTIADGRSLQLHIGNKTFSNRWATFRLFIMSPIFLYALVLLINLFLLPEIVRVVILFSVAGVAVAGIIFSSKKFQLSAK